MVLALSLLGKYFPYNYCKMAIADDIRHKIREFLTANGKSRGKAIADYLIAHQIGSEKTVYREIKAMWTSGELYRTEHSRANIEYELVELSKVIEKRLEYTQKVLDNIDKNIAHYYPIMNNPKKKMQKIERLFFIVQRMRQLQTVETILRIYENHEAFKKSKTYTEQKRKITEFWKYFYEFIFTQPEKDFSHDVFRNFPIVLHEILIPVEKNK